MVQGAHCAFGQQIQRSQRGWSSTWELGWRKRRAGPDPPCAKDDKAAIPEAAEVPSETVLLLDARIVPRNLFLCLPVDHGS